jgi:hypothetical protein
MTRKLFIPGLAMCSGLLLAQTSETMPAQTNNSNMPQSTASMSGSNTWTGLLVAMGCDNNAGSASMASNTSSEVTGSAMTGPALNGSSGSGMNGTSTNMTGASATAATQTMTSQNGQPGMAPDMARASTPGQSDTYGSSSTAAGAQRNSEGNNTGTADRASSMTANTPVATDQNFPKSTTSAAHESSGTMNRATDATAGMSANTSDKGMSNGQSGWDSAKTIASQMGPSCRIASSTASFALRTADGRLIPFDSASNAKIADQVRDRVSSSSKIFRVVVKGTMSGDTITADSVRL